MTLSPAAVEAATWRKALGIRIAEDDDPRPFVYEAAGIPDALYDGAVGE